MILFLPSLECTSACEAPDGAAPRADCILWHGQHGGRANMQVQFLVCAAIPNYGTLAQTAIALFLACIR
jgi:hypothetical protein